MLSQILQLKSLSKNLPYSVLKTVRFGLHLGAGRSDGAAAEVRFKKNDRGLP